MMKLTGKVIETRGDKYTLEVEPGEFINIVFDPNGVNSPLNSNNEKRALSIRAITLPNGDLALAVSFNDNLLFKEIQQANSYPTSFVMWRNWGMNKAEFVLNKECPRVELILEKVDSQELLK